jgi:hypothetical protein
MMTNFSKGKICKISFCTFALFYTIHSTFPCIPHTYVLKIQRKQIRSAVAACILFERVTADAYFPL